MKTLQFGIEIETVGLRRDLLAQAIRGAVGGTVEGDWGDAWRVIDAQGRKWRVVYDGSLSDGINSGEIVSPVLIYDDLELLQSVVRAVRTAGARVDDSAGIHYARVVVMRSRSPTPANS